MTITMVRIAMGQMLVKFGNPQRNIQRACDMIEQASELNCDIIVLPECMDLGWTYPEAGSLAKPIPGEYSDVLCQAAKKAGIYVVAGLTERCGDELFNAAIMISSEGLILTKHRKINELDIARHLYSIGDTLSVVKTPFGRIGINICADNAPSSLELGRAQGRMGAQLILSPSSWAVRKNHDNIEDPYGDMWLQSYKSLAESYGVSVVGVTNVGWVEGGAWDGWKCIGCSLAVGSDGEVIASGSYGDQMEELISIECKIVNK